MIYKSYSIKDTKTGEFAAPFLAKNDLDAVRTLSDWVNNPQMRTLYMHTEDMQLFKIGEFNVETGEFISKVEFLANAIEYKENKGE